jgi:hypothetical protein
MRNFIIFERTNIMSRHIVTETGFGLVIGFINRFTARNYKQLQQFHTPTTTHKSVLLFTRQFFIFTTNLLRLPSTDISRELLRTVWCFTNVAPYITSAPTAQKTSHAFLIVACRPIAAELRSNAEMCLPLRCVATFATRTL